MKLSPGTARARLAAEAHGVLATLHPERGPDPQPVVYAVSGEYVGVPIDSVKPKSSTRLRREDNLGADPRASLLIEHWDPADWSRLWWVRINGEGREASPEDQHRFASLLADRCRQYADPETIARGILVTPIGITGWSAT